MSSNKGFGFSGFQMKPTPQRHNAVPPPASFGVNKQGYTTMNAISQTALSSWQMPRKKAKTEDEYFDDDDEETEKIPDLAYIPAPGSPSEKMMNSKNKSKDDSDSEEDPLDAFMAGIQQEVSNKKQTCQKTNTINSKDLAKIKGVRADIEEEDDEESYYRYMEENPNAGVLLDENSDNEIEYDEDGNPIAPTKKKEIDPLPPIDHSEIDYQPFEKNFYNIHEDIASLTSQQVNELRQTLGIKVTGASPPYPVTSFAHFGFDEALTKQIIRSEYSQPTPIQSQAIPALLSGRDIIGIAKTGSGKTAAFLWPMLVHIMDQKELSPGDGPIGLILAPTRELSQQIYNEARKFGKIYNIQVCCCYGGGSKWEQCKALEAGAEIVVATPGRMIDLIKMKATNLRRVTYLVLDEADRMFHMGFEPQVRSICDHVRPDRQTSLFSATFKKKIEKLARDVLTDPIRIVQGDIGEANADVTQHVFVMKDENEKWNWLLINIIQLLSNGSVLIFVTKKLDAEKIANQLELNEHEVLLLHGDMDQFQRNKVITAFKKKEINLLVATDVAARGLDIPHIKTVVNYDIARDIDTHTHRIGRTGRAGDKGTAYTLVLEKDKEFAGHLVRNLEGVNQQVPNELLELAMQSSWFRKSRFKSGKGKNLNIGGCGLGFKERPGRQLNQSNNSVSDTINKAVPKSGPATDRLAAMKAAFKAQYQSQFCASIDNSWEQNVQVPQPGVTDPINKPPEASSTSTKRKKSRWE